MTNQAKKMKYSSDVSIRHERRIIGVATNKILEEFNDITLSNKHLSSSVVNNNQCKSSEITLNSLDDNVDSHIDSDSSSSSESVNGFSASTDADDLDLTDFKDKLISWSKHNNISNKAITELLHILQQNFPCLPRDARSLLQTPRAVSLTNCSGGSFVYFGVKENIIKIASSGLVKGYYPIIEKIQTLNRIDDILTLTVNVDGLPLHRSSKVSFWPILGILDQCVNRTPFIIAIYCGESKPNDANEFFSSFVSECSELEIQGISVKGKNYGFRISCFVADAPARSFLKCIVSHNSLIACEKCTQEGTFLRRSTWQYQTNVLLRTDDEFRNQFYERHQRCRAIISNLRVGLVSQVPLDWMHLICLGVVKRLIRVWVDRGPKKAKLSSIIVQQISGRLQLLSRFTPREFSRKMRTLDLFKFWKATELRAFVLYFGPIVLHNLLPKHLYEHFLLLHVAVYILASSYYCKIVLWRNYANDLLHTFVKFTAEYYTKELLVYNFHNLLHVANDVANFGSLDSYSSFPFENFMQTIKRMIRGPNKSLQQVAKRLGEKSGQNEPSRKKNRIIFDKTGKLKFVPLTENSQCVIGTDSPDNCFSTIEGDIVVINAIIKNSVPSSCYNLRYQIFKVKTDFFLSPLPSSRLGIFKVENLVGSAGLKSISSAELDRKCLLVPDFINKNAFLCIPFCNMNLLY